jgi:hypothetical protein
METLENEVKSIETGFELVFNVSTSLFVHWQM